MAAAEIVVTGAGALGATLVWRLARAGHRVTVVDPGAPNASSIAAGMLAPAFEAVFDAAAADHFALLRGARDLWPALADEIGLPMARDGAVAIGSEIQARDWCARLAAFGAHARLLGPGAADAVAGLPPDAWGAFTPEDWRLDPPQALARLRAGAGRLGARFVRGEIVGFEPGQAQLADGGLLPADRLVLATGASPALRFLAPELAALTPIKGHILRTEGAFRSAPVVRAAGAYLVRADGHVVLGATMEPGRRDASVDPAVVDQLLATAAPLTAALGPVRWRAAAGVRAATPDGLPLAGESRGGAILAVGARRNGWLLAPLIAEVVLGVIEGGPPSAAAAAFDPRRLALTPG